MPPEAPAANELFRFGELAFDVATIFGVTTEQGLKRARRSLNRAAIAIAGHDRNWSWLRVKDSLYTSSGIREYSLPEGLRADIEHFWMEGSYRGKLTRIPTNRFVKAEPDASTTSGTPQFFDYEGVDSSGCMQFSFFPVPSARIQIHFRGTREIVPIDDDDKDVRAYWGLPQSMLEPLIKKAAAICVQGVSTQRFEQLSGEADALIEAAYAADQSRKNTTYRAPMIEASGGPEFDDPRLPPQFDRED